MKNDKTFLNKKKNTSFFVSLSCSFLFIFFPCVALKFDVKEEEEELLWEENPKREEKGRECHRQKRKMNKSKNRREKRGKEKGKERLRKGGKKLAQTDEENK